jgi:hypothetical protein
MATATEADRLSRAEIRAAIEHVSKQRAEVLHALSLGHDRALARERATLDDRLAGLWETHRLVRARLRYGDRNEIKRRARTEERLNRAA